MQKIKDIFKTVDMLFQSCDIDYSLLKGFKLDEELFNDYNKQRVVNSFLFNYIKIQDKIGAKLFKNILFQLKEIDDFSVPMLDVLNILEKLEIIDSTVNWDRLREIRNALAHEYPLDINERIENIKICMTSYEYLKKTFTAIKQYCIKKGLV